MATASPRSKKPSQSQACRRLLAKLRAFQREGLFCSSAQMEQMEPCGAMWEMVGPVTSQVMCCCWVLVKGAPVTAGFLVTTWMATQMMSGIHGCDPRDIPRRHSKCQK